MNLQTKIYKKIFPYQQFVLEILAIMVLVSIVNIYFIIPTVIMGFVLYGFRFVYVSASRNIKRVESITRSPIYAHTNATLQGLSTIRAFKAEDSVKRDFNIHLDHNSSVSSPSVALKREMIYRCFTGLVHVLDDNPMLRFLA